jgi:hypothetical protein
MIQAFFNEIGSENEQENSAPITLFSYFMNFAIAPEKEFNDVLSGYCAKVLINLISK